MLQPLFTPNSTHALYAVRRWPGSAAIHVLHDCARGKIVLIDTGLFGEMSLLAGLLAQLKLSWNDIEAILLTHGHLDHTGNLARLRKLTHAPLYAHPAEQPHIDGCYPYQGVARWCGRLEAIGRLVFRYHSVVIDHPLADGELLPFWGGLRVLHLPGHTAGHCGFYSETFKLLFAGDLFASYFFSTHLPAPILNSFPEKIPASLQRIQNLDPTYILPNHFDLPKIEHYRSKFQKLLAQTLPSQ